MGQMKRLNNKSPSNHYQIDLEILLSKMQIKDRDPKNIQ